MTVTVVVGGQAQRYTSAVRFVREDGTLRLYGPDDTEVATFEPGAWEHVGDEHGSADSSP